MSKPPRDPKAAPDATDPKTTSEKIDEVQKVIDDAREHLDELDDNARERRDEEE